MKNKISLQAIFDNKKAGIIIFHLCLCILTWIISKYFSVGPFTRDNLFITNILCTIFFFQTLFIYYCFSLFIFPRYLYKKKVIPFILSFLVIFLLVYWCNYFSIRQLLPYSNGYASGKYQDVWIQKVYGLFLIQAGWFGCFTMPKVASWNFWYSFEVPTIYLSIKYFRDTIEFQRNNMMLKNNNLALERDNLALELGFLKSQINPHFLFNTLNSIYNRTLDVDDQASDLVLKLSGLMRYSLYGVNEDRVPLIEEIEYIENYLDLEKYRHSSDLVKISMDTEGITERHKIAPLLLISLVENAFKHGVNLSIKSSYVHISVLVENDTLYFTVQNSLPENSKTPIVITPSKKSGGIGLSNTRKRLSMLYPDVHELTFQKTELEYEVTLQIFLNAD
ncbi:sensor histidine kinase [Dyadobacter subterraneus]|uniref:Sensor histidine kinase n=1 Tax=Dyadobacter subterraneus TaxID=2773304 RepID=A0ABR9WDF6_9BACT|nr:histidine kinase [Dyadobacter subterraneus]MBE9463526.1 sensor histidine kinase [Dyadobacter subterraneus]